MRTGKILADLTREWEMDPNELRFLMMYLMGQEAALGRTFEMTKVGRSYVIDDELYKMLIPAAKIFNAGKEIYRSKDERQ